MTENLTVDYFKPVIEGLLFISDKPVMIDQVKDVLKTASIPEIKKALLELKEDYDETTRGMTILEIAGGYQMLSSPHYASYIRDFFKRRVKEKLSRPALETLAIIAYKQPVSRGDIELIRGVNSDGVTINLLEKGLIKVMGRKDVPGRPYLYGTTKLFLEYFGLKSLRDLPKLGDFPALALSVNEASEGGGIEENQAAEPVADGQATADSAAPEPEQISVGENDTTEGNAAVSDEAGEDSVVDLKKAMEEVSAEEFQGQEERETKINNHLADEAEDSLNITGQRVIIPGMLLSKFLVGIF